MTKHDLQREVYYMVCNYYDKQQPQPAYDVLTSYIHYIFELSAKDTKHAYNYWKELSQ